MSAGKLSLREARRDAWARWVRGLALVTLLAFVAGCAAPPTVPATETRAPAMTSTAVPQPLSSPSATASPLSPSPTVPSNPTPMVGTSPTAAIAASPTPRAAQVGYLEGHVSIGPLTPVERVDVPSPTPSPQVCTSRGLAVFDAAGNAQVTSFAFQPDCNYRVALSPGSYVVRLSPEARVGGAKSLPRTVVIEAGKTTRLDLDVDTGIR